MGLLTQQVDFGHLSNMNFIPRCSSEAEERAGLRGTLRRADGGALVVPFQHLSGAGGLRPAEEVELWHPAQRGHRHPLAGGCPGWFTEPNTWHFIRCENIKGASPDV